MKESGLANQGWKDSWDSIFHADGTLAKGPIALCEVQAYVFAAWRAARPHRPRAGLAEARAAAMEAKAEALRERFEAAFWCDDLGTYALALDGTKRPCRVRASNAGHVLLGGWPRPSGRPRSRGRCWMAASSPAGASARWRRPRPATTR